MESSEACAANTSEPADEPVNGGGGPAIDRRTRLAVAAYVTARALYSTLRVHCENLSLTQPAEGRGVIIVTWHGRSLIPANLFRDRGYWALISWSRDGELQTNVFRRFGFQIVRGSTGKGGIRGALTMARKVREGGALTFTPDGPRGPTHKVQPGVILMAEKSGAPIIPLGVSASRRWLVKSWDAYMIPKPFARAYVIAGEPIYVPPKGGQRDREAMCVQLEHAINRLEKEAERRAGHPDYPPEWPTD